MANAQGGRINDTFLVTLAATIAAKSLVTLAGLQAADNAFGFVALESGVSGQKIAVQLSGVAVVTADVDGVTAGDLVNAGANGLGQTLESGTSIGVALETATSGQDFQVALGAG